MDLEERTVGTQMNRRTFLKVGGLVAGGAVAAWLGLNWLAPDVVPGPAINYITVQELMDKLNNCEFKSAGEIIYVRDIMLRTAEYYAEHDKTVIKIPNIIQNLVAGGNHTYLKKGDIFIFSSPTMEYATPRGEGCKYFIDSEDLKNKNTMKRG